MEELLKIACEMEADEDESGKAQVCDYPYQEVRDWAARIRAIVTPERVAFEEAAETYAHIMTSDFRNTFKPQEIQERIAIARGVFYNTHRAMLSAEGEAKPEGE
jgi:hypothetical protein